MSMVRMEPDEKENPAPGQSCHGGCGLCLCLDEGQAEALGLGRNPPRAGDQVGIRAIAQVRRVTQEVEPEEGEEAEAGVTLELHITDMEVTPSGREPASVLYGPGQG